MQERKARNKRSIQKKKTINKKDQKAVIYLDPEKLQYPEGLKNEDHAHTGIEWDDESVGEKEAEAFRSGHDSGIYEGVGIGNRDGFNRGLKITESEQSRIRGRHKKDKKTRLPGIVAAVKQFKIDSAKPSFGKFWQFISHSKYSNNTPFQIDGYFLYVEGDKIYHNDETEKTKRGKIISKIKSIKKDSVERYYNKYSNEITPQ
jgi:hypothetical protein